MWVASALGISGLTAGMLGAGALGAGATIYGANKAASAQESAAQTAANTQLSMFDKTQGYLAPYRNIGSQAADYTSKNLNSLIAPVNVDTSILNDPNSTIGQAYNFINTQGQRGVTNSAAARGLATSGAALKGASTFATGTADQYYNNLFNMGVTNQTNAFNRLQGLINTGGNAAAGTGQAATSTGQGVAASQTAAGNAAAAGYNAIGTGVTNFSNNLPLTVVASGLYGKNNPSAPATGLPISQGAQNYNSGNSIY